MYQLNISKVAIRQIKSISSEYVRNEALEMIELLPDDPYLPDSQLEEELSNRYRLKINGWRIIYKVNEQDKTIRILTVRKRNRSTYLNVP